MVLEYQKSPIIASLGFELQFAYSSQVTTHWLAIIVVMANNVNTSNIFFLRYISYKFDDFRYVINIKKESHIEHNMYFSKI